MIYSFLKRIIKVTLVVFFKKIVVSGKQHIPTKGPLIIVANHPNTFMDPLIVAALSKQRVGFVANGGIFINKLVSNILRYFHIIPVYRKQDRLPGQKSDHSRTFEKCHEYLGRGGSILIFPEGSSYYELNLREIKTGTARIALSFAALENFDNRLQILPIALEYSDAIQFRSSVSVTVNAPISIADYKEIYAVEERAAIKQLTEDIGATLGKTITQTTGKQQEAFLIKAHKFYITYHEPTANLHQNPKRSLSLRKLLAQALNFIKATDDILYRNLEKKLHTFFNELEKAKLTPGLLTASFIKKKPLMVFFNYFLKFIILLPIYIFGLFTNYLPYILPYKVFKILGIDIAYKAPIQMIVGLFTFPLFYTFEVFLFREFISRDLNFTLLFLLTLPISGYVTMYYWLIIRRFIRVVRYYFFIKPSKKKELIELRDILLKHLENAKSIYLGKSA
jgi:1-acyl-sn-glycerol-3-phosphate acyltransferase